MTLRGTVLAALAVALLIPTTPLLQTEPFSWPRVKPVSKSYYFSDASKATTRFSLQSVDGTPLYLFQCAPGYVHPDGSIENLECSLGSVSTAEQGQAMQSEILLTDTLLSTDPLDGTVAHSRGEIWAGELEGSCASYPEWGNVRNFRLRAMILSLEFRQVVFHVVPNLIEQPQDLGARGKVTTISSFAMNVTVIQDPTALSAVAERVPFLAPASFRGAFFESAVDCAKPIPTHVPGVITEDYLKEEGLRPPYPEVTPTEKTFYLRGRPTPADFQFPDKRISAKARAINFPIVEPTGEMAYQFECSAYNVPIGNGRIDRYGIVCGLFAAGKDLNLLADSVDPYSKMIPSQVLPDQLYGKCADYPQWGAHREFRLRGFQLILEFSNPAFTSGEFQEHALSSVKLRLAVRPDPGATDPVALPSKYIYWGFLTSPHPCQEILINPRAGEQPRASPK